ncbi:MAG TPA: ABC transporter permease [Steroidobacteraceae bacterium]|nr:ABC transporter permease [Steroidobacteraceae bacterium]
MSALKEMRAVIAMNMRSIPQRAGTSMVIVIGIAGVVTVLISVLSLATGLSKTLSSTGRPERAIVFYGGSQSETASNISRDAVATILSLPGIRSDSDGKPVATADALSSVWLPKIDGELGSVALRGVSAKNSIVRPEMKLLEGRLYQSGLHELIVGKSAQARFKGLRIGDRIRSGDVDWQVVGVFESNGDAHESELLADADTLLSAARRTAFNSVTVWLDSTSSFDTFKASVTTNPTLTLDVLREGEYYEQQSKRFGTFLSVVANVIGVVMAIGAIFGALNTMYSAVSARAVEIATLRAIGFGASGVVASVIVEALSLSIVGALLGSAFAWLLFNGNSVSTISGGSGLTQVAFHLRIGGDLVSLGVLWACMVGLLGGLFPAIRAARMPVAAALREV